MTLGDQLRTLKNNWLLVLVLIVFLFGSMVVMIGITGLFSSVGSSTMSIAESNYGLRGGLATADYAAKGMPVPMMDGDFAPEVEGRQIIKTASITNEVERGTYKSAEKKLKDIVASSDSFILNENVNTYDRGRKEYKSGYYQLKVDVTKYDSVISQLKDLGEVVSFNENADDVTGRYTDLNVELAAEKERLKRFKEMYSQAEEIKDKIELNDRIFNQERTIKYYEQQIENIDKRVEYSTVSVRLQEKRSEYADIAFVKLSQLVKNIVMSINSLFHLATFLIPYIVVFTVLGFGIRWLFRRKNA